MKTRVPKTPSAAKGEMISVTRHNPGPHLRLPQRSDKVEGDEADIGAVSSDPRTAAQDPPIQREQE